MKAGRPEHRRGIKALITAAGMGKRLGALTRRMNKSLLTIGGKPLISHIIENLRSRGMHPLYVVTGHESERLAKVMGNGVTSVFNPFYRVTGILGSFWAARSFLDGQAFLFTTCDHFFHPSVLEGCLKGSSDVRIVVQKKKRYTKEDAKVIIRGSRVVQISKAIKPEAADGEFGGMATFSPRASTLFFKELECRFKRRGLDGYMMELLQILQDRHAIPIRYALCPEASRIEVDSVHDLVRARQLEKGFKRGA